MRLGWLSNSMGSATGYGTPTRLLVPPLHKGGQHQVDVFAFFGQEGHVEVNEDGIRTFPRHIDPYMNDIILAHCAFCQVDALITLIDPFVLNPEVYGQVPWAAWTPVDSVPALPGNIEAVRSARWVWAMARFGYDQLQVAGLGPKLAYVPLPVDCEIYKPGNRQEAREKVGKGLETDLTGAFLVLMNAANKGFPSRKGFGYAIEAFKVFSDRHPEARLLMHTEQLGVWGGETLDTVIAAAGLDPKKVLFSKQYMYEMGMYGMGHLNNMYNAADVLLQPSLGEGFGLPIVEAQSAGCPVIVTDFSAMPELCFAGWKVPGTLVYTSPGAQMCIPDVKAIDQSLEAASERSEALRAQARDGALAYDVKRVLADYLLPVLGRIGADLQRAKSRREKRLEKKGATHGSNPRTKNQRRAAKSRR